MKHKVEITYEWWGEDGNEVKKEYRKALEDAAMSRVKEMMVEGYTSGELHSSLYIADETGECEVNYNGWWSLTTKVEA